MVTFNTTLATQLLILIVPILVLIGLFIYILVLFSKYIKFKMQVEKELLNKLDKLIDNYKK